MAVIMCYEIPPPELENLVHPRLAACGELSLDIVSTEKSYLFMVTLPFQEVTPMTGDYEGLASCFRPAV